MGSRIDVVRQLNALGACIDARERFYGVQSWKAAWEKANAMQVAWCITRRVIAEIFGEIRSSGGAEGLLEIVLRPKNSRVIELIATQPRGQCAFQKLASLERISEGVPQTLDTDPYYMLGYRLSVLLRMAAESGFVDISSQEVIKLCTVSLTSRIYDIAMNVAEDPTAVKEFLTAVFPRCPLIGIKSDGRINLWGSGQAE